MVCFYHVLFADVHIDVFLLERTVGTYCKYKASVPSGQLSYAPLVSVLHCNSYHKHYTYGFYYELGEHVHQPISVAKEKKSYKTFFTFLWKYSDFYLSNFHLVNKYSFNKLEIFRMGNSYFEPSFADVLKVFEHLEHWNGFSLLCAPLIWRCRCLLDEKESWHKSHLKGFIPRCTVFLCDSSEYSYPKLFSHTLHLKVLLCLSLIWELRYSCNQRKKYVLKTQKQQAL